MTRSLYREGGVRRTETQQHRPPDGFGAGGSPGGEPANKRLLSLSSFLLRTWKRLDPEPEELRSFTSSELVVVSQTQSDSSVAHFALVTSDGLKVTFPVFPVYIRLV